MLRSLLLRALLGLSTLSVACSQDGALSSTETDLPCVTGCADAARDAGHAGVDSGGEHPDAGRESPDLGSQDSTDASASDSGEQPDDGGWRGRHPSAFWTLPQNAPGFDELGDRLVQSVAFTSDRIWAGTAAGLSVSEDWGATWETRTTLHGLPSNLIEDLAIDGDRIYVATPGGPAFSTDGVQFTRFPESSSAPSFANTIAALGDLILIDALGSLARSVDGGSHFTSSVVSDLVQDISLTPTRACIATLSHGLGVSTDQGESFQFTVLGRPEDSGENLSSVFCDPNGDRIIATNPFKAWLSNDGVLFEERTSADGLCPGIIGDARAIGQDVIVVSSSGVARSHDGGQSFTCDHRTTSSRSLGWAPPRIAAGGGLGLSLSNDDGVTWSTAESMRSAGPSAQFYSVWVDDDRIFASAPSGSHQSLDRGSSFLSLGTSGWLRTIVRSAPLIAAISLSGLLVSTDDGLSFETRTATDGLGADVLYDIAVGEQTVFVATRGGLSVSNDLGRTFTTRTTADGLPDDLVSDVAVLGTSVFAATARGLAVSRDSGESFAARDSAHGLALPPETACSEVAAVAQSVYVVCSGRRLFYSEDAGESFQPSSFPVPADVISIAASGSHVALGTRGAGAFLSPDGGRSFWSMDGYAGRIVSDLTFHDGFIYLANDGERRDGGLFRSAVRVIE